jgi:hypothetical protein
MNLKTKKSPSILEGDFSLMRQIKTALSPIWHLHDPHGHLTPQQQTLNLLERVKRSEPQPTAWELEDWIFTVSI